MATIRKLCIGTKSWQSIVRVKGTRPLSKTFSTKRDAIRWASQLETEIAQGVFADVTQAERYKVEIVPQKRGQ